MEREELEILRNEYDNYKEYLTQQGRQELHRQGFGVVDSDGDLVTPLVNNEECAYACFDADLNCYCAIEKSYCNGKTKFKKPISCSLYPIRVGVLSNGVKTLNLHRWIICGEAFKKGRELKIPVYKFLKEPLIKRFGEEFYNALEEAANSLSNKKDNQE